MLECFIGFTPGDSPLEGGRVEKSIHLLWLQVEIVCGYESSIMRNLLLIADKYPEELLLTAERDRNIGFLYM